MKKIILFACLSGLLFAGTKSDVAFTAGYNKFDDPTFLRSGHMAYGIRGGMYMDNGLGYQLGFEHISNANCKGLKLNRIYANALMTSQQQAKLKPYGLVTVGYETSSVHEHKPSQLFVGAGVGLKYAMTPHVNAFVETRVLQKLRSHDSDVITTVGLSYALDATTNQSYALTPPMIQVPRSQVKTIRPEYVTQVSPTVQKYTQAPRQSIARQSYYVQLAALSQNSANPLLSKLYKRGINNADIQQVHRNGRVLSIVVVGPYQSKYAASKNLRRLKQFSHGAFVTKL
jgi:hypothetical protein